MSSFRIRQCGLSITLIIHIEWLEFNICMGESWHGGMVRCRLRVIIEISGIGRGMGRTRNGNSAESDKKAVESYNTNIQYNSSAIIALR